MFFYLCVSVVESTSGRPQMSTSVAPPFHVVDALRVDLDALAGDEHRVGHAGRQQVRVAPAERRIVGLIGGEVRRLDGRHARRERGERIDRLDVDAHLGPMHAIEVVGRSGPGEQRLECFELIGADSVPVGRLETGVVDAKSASALGCARRR